MIIGIGIDLISNDRIKKIIKKFDQNFKEKIFSKNELNDFENRYKNQEKLTQNAINFFAKRFASKEAFSKALGIGIGRGIDFNDIENSQMSVADIEAVVHKRSDFCLVGLVGIIDPPREGISDVVNIW